MKTTMENFPALDGVQIKGSLSPGHREILCAEALAFYAQLHRRFNQRRLALLQQRRVRQTRIDAGDLPDFPGETRNIREGQWQVLPVPEDLRNRKVEITGPVDRKMFINALNSGADCYMADFEDAHCPTWEATLDGQVNARDAVRETISYVSPEGKQYKLNNATATLMVRPRGWHLEEKHLLVDGEPASGSLFDFALYFFHNARYRVMHDSGVYFYLPKIEHYLEARLWNDVFVFAQDYLGIPQGTIKATVLIETILAAFQMEEILYELRHHSAGLNCGRWDYIFSYIKKLSAHPQYLVPDRAQVTMTTPFMRAYSLLCIKTCHKRGAFAMGGMSAFIPIRNNPLANETALAKVREDKQREARDGHDGTWVAHPGLVAVARGEFDKVLGAQPNQISRQRDDVQVTRDDLLRPPTGTITEEGVRLNLRVAIQYLEAWLGGLGCVPLYNLMEDAATAEISRTQLWQWLNHPGARLPDGRRIDEELIGRFVGEELERIRQERGDQRFANGRFPQAVRLLEDLIYASRIPEFLTLQAYHLLDEPGELETDTPLNRCTSPLAKLPSSIKVELTEAA